jgi:hypothetical protein
MQLESLFPPLILSRVLNQYLIKLIYKVQYLQDIIYSVITILLIVTKNALYLYK